MSDIRTYPHHADIDAEQAPACVPYAEFAFYAAENARLTNELDTRIRQLMDVSRHCGQLLTANETLRNELAAMTAHWRNAESDATTAKDNAAELGKALDMCITERDQAYRDLDAQTLKANSFRRELHRYMQHAIELKDMLDASVAERDALRADLNAERVAHNATAAQLYAELAEARAELDAMQQAHGVIAAQMQAMGC